MIASSVASEPCSCSEASAARHGTAKASFDDVAEELALLKERRRILAADRTVIHDGRLLADQLALL